MEGEYRLGHRKEDFRDAVHKALHLMERQTALETELRMVSKMPDGHMAQEAKKRVQTKIRTLDLQRESLMNLDLEGSGRMISS